MSPFDFLNNLKKESITNFYYKDKKYYQYYYDEKTCVINETTITDLHNLKVYSNYLVINFDIHVNLKDIDYMTIGKSLIWTHE